MQKNTKRKKKSWRKKKIKNKHLLGRWSGGIYFVCISWHVIAVTCDKVETYCSCFVFLWNEFVFLVLDIINSLYRFTMNLKWFSIIWTVVYPDFFQKKCVNLYDNSTNIIIVQQIIPSLFDECQGMKEHWTLRNYAY